jgi:hypothetical protein
MRRHQAFALQHELHRFNLHRRASAPSRGRRHRRICTCLHPKGSVAPAPTSAPPGALPQPPSHTSARPTGSGAPEATSAPPGARPKQRLPGANIRQMFSSTFDTFCEMRCAASVSQWKKRLRLSWTVDECKALPSAHVRSPHGQPCSISHFIMCRCPPRAALPK